MAVLLWEQFVSVCVALRPWENTAHYFRRFFFPLLPSPLRISENVSCGFSFRPSVCLSVCIMTYYGKDLRPTYRLIVATNESVVVCGCVLLCTLMSAYMKGSLLPSGCLRFQPGVALDGWVFGSAARYNTYMGKKSWTQHTSVCALVERLSTFTNTACLHYTTK